MLSREMHTQAAWLLRAARTERGERREHMLQEARLWIDLARLAAADVPDAPVPPGTVMRIRTCTGALTVVREATESGVLVYPWACLGCGEARPFGRGDRKSAREEASQHARGCWVLPARATPAEPRPA
ncbi:hypothetical protein [Streptomyces sp. NPDC047071]|uniref:hypothetical protein n=1 Tax=Streptomyces sp. NPDC047071 TaxID=3154808 RepID=UPI0034526FC7